MPVINGGLGTPLLSAGAPVNGTNEVQTITPDAVPAAGTFRLQFEGALTASLDFDATAAEVEAALEALATVGVGGVAVVKGGGPPEVWTVTFGGNLQNLAVPLIAVVNNTVEDGAGDPVALDVAEATPGVTATGRGAPAGARLIDVVNANMYVNNGVPLAPSWGLVVDDVNVIAGPGPGFSVAWGQHETVAAVDTVVTGLSLVVGAWAVLEDDPGLDPLLVQASIGDQAGAPAAGSILVKSWKATAANDVTPIAATTFAKKVRWLAIGTA